MAKGNINKAIDDLRDTIVGKIPLPNTQVEQITLALLYKFMDDMDNASITLGGNKTFFAGDYEKYSWKKIMSQSIGAQTRYNLYVEALEKFYVHPNLPDTFKSIFKNATVPYRDPETLTNFLKIIDKEFDYSDSEQLGDAYEYLLSILGSQGDLGQFRTPRNIIDFIVEMVEPKKENTILDPACGTAGFLISAYKYILRNNTDETEGDKLSFDEKKQILNNICGYDIEPSMVKIAEMNLYLHGAAEPKIYEYDTLTMDDKWNDKYACILANPPFMTPKGGIKPHSRFGVKANKAEVLFVDYIQSHLNINGRAGIIVPEGIIFQTGKAYKDLRKNLIENSLVAVISLPNGIFNPYSPVKTSILLLDKKLAKEKEDILFVELKNDGYTLGTQRKPTEGNEIPEITKVFKDYKEGTNINYDKALIISKERLLKDTCSLDINKYKEITIEKIEYEDPKVILKQIIEMEEEFQKGLKELGEMLK